MSLPASTLPCALAPGVCVRFFGAACSEGILWHILTTPMKISQSLLMKYKEAVGDLYCEGGDEKGHTMKLVNGSYYPLPSAGKGEVPIVQQHVFGIGCPEVCSMLQIPSPAGARCRNSCRVQPTNLTWQEWVATQAVAPSFH